MKNLTKENLFKKDRWRSEERGIKSQISYLQTDKISGKKEEE